MLTKYPKMGYLSFMGPIASLRNIFIIILVSGLFGCSDHNTARAVARENFKEKIATVKICSESSTYEEFRHAEMDLKAGYEVNKLYLDDVSNSIVNLIAVMDATDYFWSFKINHPYTSIPADEECKSNIQITTGQTMKTITDFFPEHYAQQGLAKVNEQATAVLKILEN
jgi:hypothetical protein